MIKIDYRTIVWSFGASIILIVILAQVSSWIKLDWTIGRWLSIIFTIVGLIIGFILDQYYKKKERR